MLLLSAKDFSRPKVCKSLIEVSIRLLSEVFRNEIKDVILYNDDKALEINGFSVNFFKSY